MNLKLFSLTGIIFLNILIQKFERREYKTKVQVKCERLENGKIFEFQWSQGIVRLVIYWQEMVGGEEMQRKACETHLV